MEKKGTWERFKLEDILNNPAFLGKTVRLGDNLFEVKGVVRWSRREYSS